MSSCAQKSQLYISCVLGAWLLASCTRNLPSDNRQIPADTQSARCGSHASQGVLVMRNVQKPNAELGTLKQVDTEQARPVVASERAGKRRRASALAGR